MMKPESGIVLINGVRYYATVGVLTMAAHAGATIVLEAYQAKWNVISLNATTITS